LPTKKPTKKPTKTATNMAPNTAFPTALEVTLEVTLELALELAPFPACLSVVRPASRLGLAPGQVGAMRRILRSKG
jgi:hypothetical protein